MRILVFVAIGNIFIVVRLEAIVRIILSHHFADFFLIVIPTGHRSIIQSFRLRLCCFRCRRQCRDRVWGGPRSPRCSKHCWCMFLMLLKVAKSLYLCVGEGFISGLVGGIWLWAFFSMNSRN